MSDASVVNPAEHAFANLIGGAIEEATRTAIAVVESDPLQLFAAEVLAEALLSRGRNETAGSLGAFLVLAHLRRSDLAAATSAAQLAIRAEAEDAEALYRTIARAFCQGSPRLADVAPAPPPLPSEAWPEGVLAKLSGEGLIARAENAARKVIECLDPLDDDGKVTALPLFSSLPEPALEALLRAFTVRDFGAGDWVLKQGEEGREAFVTVHGTLRAERSGEPGTEANVLAVLGPGAIFGEMALVSDAPRAASIVVVDPVRLLVASREALESIARDTPTIGRELSTFCRNRMMANLVRHSSILNAVPAAEQSALLSRFVTCTWDPGAELTEEGTEPNGLHLIASGRVEVVGTDVDGDSIRITELGPGDVVGEIGLVLRRPATATVRATHPTVSLHLTREQFHDAIKEHPTLLNELYETAVRREEETRTVVAQQALDVKDMVLL